MSQRRSNVRKQTPSPKKIISKASEAPTSQTSFIKPRIISAIRIEERLLNQQITYNKRLELLKRNQEEEQMKEIQKKPKILEKSRALAEKVEQKLLAQILVKPVQSPQAAEKVCPEPQCDVSVRSNSNSKLPKNICDVSVRSNSNPKLPKSICDVSVRSNSNSKPPKSLTAASPVKGLSVKKVRTKSLISLSVLKRNEAWLEEKNKKISLRKKEMERKELNECTFSPNTLARSRHAKSMREAGSISISYISSPYSIDNEDNEHLRAKEQPKPFKSIAPYQVKVSFRCGIDLNSFLKRAK